MQDTGGHWKPAGGYTQQCDMVRTVNKVDDFGSKVMNRNERA